MRKYLGCDHFLMPRIALVDARVLKNSIIVDDNPRQAPFLSEKFGAGCLNKMETVGVRTVVKAVSSEVCTSENSQVERS